MDNATPDHAPLRIRHVTRYTYSKPLPYGLARLRLRPVDDATQRIDRWDVAIQGGSVGASFTDEHGNHNDLIEIERRTEVLEIVAEGTVTPLRNDGLSEDTRAPDWLYTLSTPLTLAGPGIADLCRGVDVSNPISAFHDLSARILGVIPFDLDVNTAAESAEAVLSRGAGVCQDHTHVMIACARLLGFPARYVSGHLALNQGAEQTAGHAWADIKIPDLGWVGFDVSNGYSPDDRYMRLAAGRDAREAAPVDGLTFGNQSERLDVNVRVEGHPMQQ